MIKFDLRPILGKKTGHLTICKDQDIKNISNCNLVTRLKCECDCGHTCYIPAYKLIMVKRNLTCGRCGSPIGRKVGSLRVISESNTANDKTLNLYKCKCDCGSEEDLTLPEINRFKMCRKCYADKLIGKKFNHFTIVGLDHYDKSIMFFKVRCECGNEKVLKEDLIVNGKVRACGECYEFLPDSYKPIYHKTAVYLARLYRAISARCNNPNAINFYSYGGRGVKMTMDKLEFIKRFYKFTDIIDKNLCIDRIDNDKGYSIDNIKWTTYDDNVRNRVFDRTDLTYDYVASRLLPPLSFKVILNNNRFKVEEFYRVAFPLPSRGGIQLCLYIHKTLKDDISLYIDKIIGFYKDVGRDIDRIKIEINKPGTWDYNYFLKYKQSDNKDINVKDL